MSGDGQMRCSSPPGHGGFKEGGEHPLAVHDTRGIPRGPEPFRDFRCSLGGREGSGEGLIRNQLMEDPEVFMRHRWIGLAALGVLILGLWLVLHPPRPILNLLRRVDPSPETGAMLVERYGCRRCHRIGDRGGILAPDLNGITRRVEDPAHVVLRLWLRDPQGIKPGTAMPNFHLSDSEIEAILAYLKELDRQGLPPQ